MINSNQAGRQNTYLEPNNETGDILRLQADPMKWNNCRQSVTGLALSFSTQPPLSPHQQNDDTSPLASVFQKSGLVRLIQLVEANSTSCDCSVSCSCSCWQQ